MKKYTRTLPAVHAIQWKDGVEHPAIKLGKNDPNDRFDDTPDGFFVYIPDDGRASSIYGRKHLLKQNEWVLFDDKRENVIGVVDDELFKQQFKVQIPEDLKSDMDFVSRLESDFGFMGSPDYYAAKARIEQWEKSN